MQTDTARHKVVIIGGGVSGLAAGVFLAKNGFDVQLFEANSKLGGCCATTTVDGYVFNDGAVYLTLVGVLDRVFAKLGLDRAELVPLRKITANFSATLLDGAVVTLGEGLDLRVEGRSIDKTQLRDELQSMMEKWGPVLRLVTEHIVPYPFSPWRMLRKGWRHLHRFRGTLASEMYHLFVEDAVRAALSGATLYSGLPSDRAPAYTILGLVAMMSEGFYLPEGGIGRIPQVLGAALERHGGKVFLNSQAEKIIIENGRVCGVEINGHGRADATAVISTASPMLTFTSLVDAEKVPSGTKRRVLDARLSHRAVSVQFGLRNTIRARGHLNMVLPPMERQQEIFIQEENEVRFPVYYVPTVTMPELAPHAGSIIEMFHPISQEMPAEDWNDSRKEQLAQSALRTLRQTYDLDVAVTRVRSPKDFTDGMHLYEGALYGLSPAAGPLELFAHTSQIPGLFFAGQSTYPGYGVATSAMSGVFAAEGLMERT